MKQAGYVKIKEIKQGERYRNKKGVIVLVCRIQFSNVSYQLINLSNGASVRQEANLYSLRDNMNADLDDDWEKVDGETEER